MERKANTEEYQGAISAMYTAGFTEYPGNDVDEFYVNGTTSSYICRYGIDARMKVSADFKLENGHVVFNGFTAQFDKLYEVTPANFISAKHQIAISTTELESRLSKADLFVRGPFIEDECAPSTSELWKENQFLIKTLDLLPEIDPVAGQLIRDQLIVKYLQSTLFSYEFGDFDEIYKKVKWNGYRQAYFPCRDTEMHAEKYTIDQAYNLLQGRLIYANIKINGEKEKVASFVALSNDQVDKNGNAQPLYFDAKTFDFERELSQLAIVDMMTVQKKVPLLVALSNGEISRLSFYDKHGCLRDGTGELRLIKQQPSLIIKNENGVEVAHSNILKRDMMFGKFRDAPVTIVPFGASSDGKSSGGHDHNKKHAPSGSRNRWLDNGMGI